MNVLDELEQMAVNAEDFQVANSNEPSVTDIARWQDLFSLASYRSRKFPIYASPKSGVVFLTCGPASTKL